MSTRLPILFIPSAMILLVALCMPCTAEEDERDQEIRQLVAKVRLLEGQVRSLQETVKAQAILIAKLKAGQLVDADPQATSAPAETKGAAQAKPKKATAPKRFRNIREILGKIPPKIHPKPQNHWDRLRITQFNAWAEDHTAEATIELTLVISGWSQHTKDGQTTFMVAFKELVACRRLGIKYRVLVAARFPADQIDNLLKRKPGDQIKVTGRIEKFEMTSSHTEREDVGPDRRGRHQYDKDGNYRRRVVARWARLDIDLVNASIK